MANFRDILQKSALFVQQHTLHHIKIKHIRSAVSASIRCFTAGNTACTEQSFPEHHSICGS